MTQADLFEMPARYPESPGWKERTTSREAAAKVAPKAPNLRAQVLAVLKDAWPNGMTADEVAFALNRRELAIRPRLSELKDLLKVEATTERRENVSGLSAKVWIWVNR
jgi:hypothetical protein